MKLLTKEWYRTMTDSGLGVMLRPDKRAEVFSEELFQALWLEKLDEWLKDRQELCPFLNQVYEEEGERRSFEEGYFRELEHFRTRTPERILKKVADPRLLALGYCTEEVFEDLKAYRALCETWTQRTIEEAWNMRKAAGLDKVWNGEYSLHDSLVLAMRREGEDLLIEFEREDPQERLRAIREEAPELLEEYPQEDFLFPEVKAIRFREALILKQERSVEKAWWLYDEIWSREEGGYEIHALLWRDQEVFELTVYCRVPEMIWTVPPKAED